MIEINLKDVIASWEDGGGRTPLEMMVRAASLRR